MQKLKFIANILCLINCCRKNTEYCYRTEVVSRILEKGFKFVFSGKRTALYVKRYSGSS